jgi:hypothetical protein
VGKGAGYANTTGSNNSFVGYGTGFSNTTGASNSFVGNVAGYSNTTGYFNSFLGDSAGYSNTTGRENSFVGKGAAYSNTTGYANSFMGRDAGYSTTTGLCNSFLGFKAGYSNTTGFNNSFLGTNAGYSNTTGNQNSFLGYKAGYSNTTGYHNNFLGFYSGYFNTTGNFNSFLGNDAGKNNTTGSLNSFVGYQSGASNTTGSHNLFLGYDANPSNGALSNAGAIGARASVSASNSLVLGAIKGVNGATDSTKVGIGTTAPAYLLHVNGVAAKPGSATWTVPSDELLKKNVSAFTDGLKVLTQVKPVWFEYNGKAGMPTNKPYVGVIAQQMKAIVPYMVGRFTYQDTTGRKTDYLDYDANALTYILVNAVKEQQGQVEQLNTRLQEKDTQIEALKRENATQIESLQAQIDQLKQLLGPALAVPAPQMAPESGGGARLWQNVPNPTDGTTRIRYNIPQQAHQAQISLYSLKGELLQSFLLTQRGEGELSVNTTTLPEGIYVYRLLIDGKQVDAKKLLRNR